MPDKAIMVAIAELRAARWTVTETKGGSAHAYATARCPDGAGCCAQFSINGTPDVPEHEASKIRRRMRRHDKQVAERQQQEEGS